MYGYPGYGCGGCNEGFGSGWIWIIIVIVFFILFWNNGWNNNNNQCNHCNN